MKLTLKLPTYILALMLAGIPAAHSATEARPAAPAVGQQLAAEKSKAKPVAQKRKKAKAKAGKRYSKATMSAFRPLNKQPASPALRHSAAHMGLQAHKSQAALAPERAAPFAIAPFAQGGLSQDDAAFVLPEIAGSNPQSQQIAESDVLGQESVSVVDRFADKPKATPLTKGPLRLRMQDKGLRASVRIPLGDN